MLRLVRTQISSLLCHVVTQLCYHRVQGCNDSTVLSQSAGVVTIVDQKRRVFDDNSEIIFSIS